MSLQNKEGQSQSVIFTALSGVLLHPGFLAAVGLALLYLCLSKNISFIHDDLFITLRYARHLLAGDGPVWNTTGPSVEGFTSVLDLILVSAVGALHIPLPIAARLVNFLCHFVLLIFVAAYLYRRTNRAGAIIGTLILTASWMLLIWDLGGLDAVLFTTLSTAGILTGIDYFDPAYSRPLRSLLAGSAYLAFAALARPEGGLLLACLWFFVAIYPRFKPTERINSLAAAVALAAIVLLPVSILR